MSNDLDLSLFSDGISTPSAAIPASPVASASPSAASASVAAVSQAALAGAPAAPAILGVSPTTGVSSSLVSESDQLSLIGSAAAGATVTIFDGTTVLGTATATAQGQWTYTTPSTLSDGANTFTATATVSGATSAASAATAVTVKAGIDAFSPLTDQWSTPITVGGLPYYVENADINGNAPWAISELNDHTLQFTLNPGDVWQDNDSERTEISGATLYAANATVNVSYQLTVQPGGIDPNLSWEVIGQMHADDNSAIVENLTADYPVYSFHLTGANGKGGGDYLAIDGVYLPSGSETPINVPGTSGNNGFLYISPQPIVRGQAYAIQMQASFQDNANGFLEVWINDVQVVDYHGPIGYGTSTYWKEGIYAGDDDTQAVTVDYANTSVSAVPYAPVIASDVLDGDVAKLGGTAESNSAVAIYDGSTRLGSVTAAGSGDWSFQTSALATRTHVFTATATDSAGAVGSASLASSISVGQESGGSGGPVTVADYLANAATLDAAGAIAISDTPAAVAAAIDTINADPHVSAITLLGSPLLDLSVAQALGDTNALNAITNSGYEIAVTDTGADVSANFDALDADSRIASIIPASGSQTLDLTVAQMTNDTSAISLLDSFGITVTDTSAHLDALSSAEIATFAADGVTQLEATDADLSLTPAQEAALGDDGISVIQPFSGGTTEVVTYAGAGDIANVLYQGVTGEPYTSYTVVYGSNGEPASASYSDGMTESWTYNADGSSSLVFSGVTGESYTASELMYNTAGRAIGTALDTTAGTGSLSLVVKRATVSSSAGALSVTVGADTFQLQANSDETINATGYSGETFDFAAGFGADTLEGFKAGGRSSDVLELQLSMFNGLSSANTAAQDVALLMSENAMIQTGTNVTITDRLGDVLTLVGATTTTLEKFAHSAFKFT